MIVHQCQTGLLELVISPDIYDEYVRVVDRLTSAYPEVEVATVFRRITSYSVMIDDVPPLASPVSRDPDDDKFLACAVHAGVEVVVTGDKDLLEVSEYQRVHILTPQQFCDKS